MVVVVAMEIKDDGDEWSDICDLIAEGKRGGDGESSGRGGRRSSLAAGGRLGGGIGHGVE